MSSRTQEPGMIRVYDRFEEDSEASITPDRCKAPDGLYCIKCKQTIYHNSRLSEDEYRTNEAGFLEHITCPELWGYPNQTSRADLDEDPIEFVALQVYSEEEYDD
jgi:hypothetical protein